MRVITHPGRRETWLPYRQGLYTVPRQMFAEILSLITCYERRLRRHDQRWAKCTGSSQGERYALAQANWARFSLGVP
jgi:hypothetical protein